MATTAVRSWAQFVAALVLLVLTFGPRPAAAASRALPFAGCVSAGYSLFAHVSVADQDLLVLSWP